MISTRSWLIGLPTLVVAAAVCIGLASPQAAPAAAAGPVVRAADLLQAFASGNVVCGPAVWASDTVPPTQTIVGGFDAYSSLWVTVANVGSTSIELHLTGGAAFATVAPHETLSMRVPASSVGPPPTIDTLDLSATDVGSGSETRVVWVLRQHVQ